MNDPCNLWDAPTVTETGTVVICNTDDLGLLMGEFASLIMGTRTARTLRVWIDPADRGVKFKFDNGTWSPPLGRIET